MKAYSLKITVPADHKDNVAGIVLTRQFYCHYIEEVSQLVRAAATAGYLMSWVEIHLLTPDEIMTQIKNTASPEF